MNGAPRKGGTCTRGTSSAMHTCDWCECVCSGYFGSLVVANTTSSDSALDVMVAVDVVSREGMESRERADVGGAANATAESGERGCAWA